MAADREPGIPGSKIVEQFGNEIRTAIDDGIKVGTAHVMRRVSLWCVFAILGGMLSGAAMGFATTSWVISQAARNATSFEVKRGDFSEVCTRVPDSPDTRPVLVCHQVP